MSITRFTRSFEVVCDSCGVAQYFVDGSQTDARRLLLAWGWEVRVVSGATSRDVCPDCVMARVEDARS